MAMKKFNSKELTLHLRLIAAEAHEMEFDGQGQAVVISKGEALARLIWKKALGYEETITDDEGKPAIVYHKPEAWAIQLAYDRMEGKTPTAIGDDDTRLKASDKVRALAKARINDLIPATAPAPKGPPTYRPKK